MRMCYGAASYNTGSATHIAYGAWVNDPLYGPVASLPQFNFSSETYLVGETNDATSLQYGFAVVSKTDPTYAAFKREPGTPHFDGGNWLYADGHVKYKLKSKVDEAVGGVANYYWLRVKP
jgi:prepilin-type processing-associated H-X9-DG protein